MLQYIKNSVALSLIALFTIASLLACVPAFAKGKAPINPIAITGKTADGKYPIYQLIGDYDDLNWRSGNRIYNSEDLAHRMAFINKSDVNKGAYKCGFICKDHFQNVVGLNPAYHFLLE